MAGTGEGKKEDADYKRLHSFPLIRVRTRRDGPSGQAERHISSTFQGRKNEILDFSLTYSFMSSAVVKR